MESSRYCFSPTTQITFFHRGNPTEDYFFLYISGKPTVWFRMITPPTIIQLTPCQTQRNTWQESPFFAHRIALRHIIVCRWRSVEMLAIASPVTLLPREDLQKVSALLCLPLQVSCVSSWNQLSKLTNVLITLTTLEIQPQRLRTFRSVFNCIPQAELKLTLKKCYLGVRQVESRRKTISQEGISPPARKIHTF